MMAKVSLDEQLAQAEARVKRLKQRKQLSEAKKAIAENAELKKRVAELEKKQTHDHEVFDLQRELKRVKDSNEWLRGAVNNLLSDVLKLPTWNASDKEITLINRQVIINRLNGILKGQQPKKK